MRDVTRKPAETAPPRLGALAKLPVFLDLAAKRAVVAGGSAGAAWKAELLAAAGAHVEVYAEAPGDEMTGLATRGAAAGRIVVHRRAWNAGDLKGAALALADAEADSEARAFFNAARAAGVPVNVIDRPEFCQFQFGSIVNRSPVVIGISTDGAAPILGQAIRRRIETMLPASVATWAALAKSLRREVMRRLPKGAPRREFWERFAERAFGPAPDTAASGAIDRLFARAASREGGRVTLVGAGPGDAELLTLKAVRALQSADVILFDDLVSSEVLELARREARRMLVGKRGQRASCSQDDINALMLKLARQGKQVVRLKSGDPMIFGRAGEEIALLEAEGIAVEVVPGVTSALAMASRLGVSLTHRDHAQSVRFVTGHARTGELPADLDWRGLADPTTTLVLYMSGRTGPLIAARLMMEGLASSTPVTVMAGVTRPHETRRHTTLGALAAGSVRGGMGGAEPILIGIGRVFERVSAASSDDGNSDIPIGALRVAG